MLFALINDLIPDWEHIRVVSEGRILFDSTVSGDLAPDLMMYRVIAIKAITVSNIPVIEITVE